MNMKPIATLIGVIFSSSLFAQDISLQGTRTIHLVTPASGAKRSLTTEVKNVKLLNIHLSEKAKAKLAENAQKALSNPYTITASAKASSIQLAMNKVPVLDQGYHGSCVTFAATAALDAVLEQGDYISQLCQLQLGNYLESNGYNPSGWDGTWGKMALAQMDAFGFMNQANQRSEGCGNVKEYPVSDSTPGSMMSPEDFHLYSESLNDHGIIWSTILDANQAIFSSNTTRTLAEVKKALLAGDRMTFGTMLVDTDLGTAGAIGTHNHKNDSWVLTPELARDVYTSNDLAGHEMVITGFDDKAIATDAEGRKYKGLLTLRNSWGEDQGDQGNFYMSYDYFNLMVIEAYRISALVSSSNK